MDPKKEGASKALLPSLTGARFVAALVVVLMHVTFRLRLTAVWRYSEIAHSAVSFFFVLSGFVLAYNYSTRFAGGLSRASLWNYARSRFARIYPMHAVALVLGGLVTLFLLRMDPRATPSGSGVGVGATEGVLSWLANLFLVQIYVLRPAYEMLWNAPGWSIACEVVFYASLPFVAAYGLPRLRTLRSLILAGLFLYAIQWALFLTAKHLVGPEPIGGMMLDYIAYRLPVFRIWEFLIGCLVGEAFRRDYRLSTLMMRNIFLGLLVVIAIAALPLRGQPMMWYVLPTPVFAATVWVLACGRTFASWLLDNRVVQLLGESSYSLYLIHYPLLYLVAYVTTQAGLSPKLSAIFVVCLSIGASILCYRWVENPGRRWLAPKRKVTPVADGTPQAEPAAQQFAGAAQS